MRSLLTLTIIVLIGVIGCERTEKMTTSIIIPPDPAICNTELPTQIVTVLGVREDTRNGIVETVEVEFYNDLNQYFTENITPAGDLPIIDDNGNYSFEVGDVIEIGFPNCKDLERILFLSNITRLEVVYSSY